MIWFFFLLYMQGPQQADLLITDGTVVTMDPSMRVMEKGALAIKEGKIAAIGTTAEITRDWRGKRIKAQNSIIMPGLINTHTHAPMTLFRGLSDDQPLKIWLEQYIWPAEAEFVDAETVRIGTELAAAEMIRSGTTTINDMYFYMDVVGKVMERAGMRAVIGESLIDFPTPNGKTPDEGLAYTRELIAKWKGHDRIHVAVSTHSPYTCSPELLKKAKALADEFDLGLQIHLSETVNEVNTIQERYGATPVGHLHKLGLLYDGLMAAHGVHLTDADRKLLAEHKVGVSHNPESNMKLASGAAPVPELLAIKAEVGLGTDGAASNNDLDMFEAMDSAAKLQKVMRGDPSLLNARDVVRMATIGGAEVLGLDDQIGSLEAGKQADIIIIPLNKPHLTPMYDPYSLLVYAVSGGDVDTVMVQGKILMENGKLKTLDEASILKEARQTAARIRDKVLQK